MDDTTHLSIEATNRFRIMIAAPDTDERYRLTGLLEREGSTVVEFDSTTLLLKHLETLSQPEETQLIHIVFVDWVLSDPVLKKLVRHLQQAPFSNIPLVALTNSACIEIKEAMMFLKHKAVLEKPIKTNELLSILNKFLQTPMATQSAATKHYTLLESNSLLELAVKNHHNALDINHHDKSVDDSTYSASSYNESSYGESAYNQSGIDYLVKDNLN